MLILNLNHFESDSYVGVITSFNGVVLTFTVPSYFPDYSSQPNTTWSPVSINDNGQVIVYTEVQGTTYGQVFANAIVGQNGLLLDPLANGEAYNQGATGAADGNNVGQIVGSSSFGDAFLYSGGNFTTIADPNVVGVGSTHLGAINDWGQILGSWDNGPGTYPNAFIYQNGVFFDLAPVYYNGVSNSTVYTDLNNAGQLVGYYVDASGTANYFVKNPYVFSAQSDVVDFNNLNPLQMDAIVQDPKAVYNGLGGSDTVTLPSEANYEVSLVNGKTLDWTDTQASTFYTNSQSGDNYAVNGTDGNYFIALGAGNDSVFIEGNGSSNITGGSGNDTIAIDGNGNNTINGVDGNYLIWLGSGTDSVLINGNGSSNITAGSGHDIITINGNGNNTINDGSGNYSISLSGTGWNTFAGNISSSTVIEINGGGVLWIMGDVKGAAIIGDNSVLELSGSDSGIVTEVGKTTTLVLDQPNAFAGQIEGLALGDMIDLSKTEVARVILSGTTLTVTESNNQTLTYQVSGDLQNNFFKQSDDGAGGTLLTLDNLPSFKVATASPGDVPYDSAVVITEGGAPGTVKVTLSAATDVPINVQVTLQSPFLGYNVTLSDFIIAPGQTSVNVPVATAIPSGLLEPIESENLIFTASAQSTPLNFEAGDNVAQLLVKDQLTSAAQLPEFANGLNWAKGIISYWSNITTTAAPLYDLSKGAQAYVDSLGKVANFAGVAIDGTVTLTQLNAHLALAQQYSDPVQQAEVAYSAYEAANVYFTNELIKGALTVSTGLFIGGVVAGLTGVALTAALPILVTVGAGYALGLPYDAYIAPLVKQALISDFESANSESAFVDGYIQAHTVNVHALEGYLSGATAFADANGNGQLDAGEASATTDATGGFSLIGGSGPLIAFGGTDTSTGLPFTGELSAPGGSTDITPLTTLLNNLQSDPSAQQKVLSSLGLSSSLNLTTFDPIAAAQGGSADGAAAEVAGAKVYDTVEMIASALAGAGGAFSSSLQAAFSALASALDGSGINLSDKTALSGLVTQVAHTESLTLGQGVADAVASVIAAGNAALDHVLQTDQPGSQLLSDTAGVELVMQGAASTAITNAGGSPSQLLTIADLFTGTNLSELISQGQSEVQNPGQDLGPLAFNGTATTDQTTVLKGFVSAVDLAAHSISYALDGSTPAGLTFNSDGTFSLDPRVAYDYLGYGQVATLSFQFTASDGQGTPGNGTETIKIIGANEIPVANADSYSATLGHVLNVAASGVLSNDSVANHDSLTAVLQSQPTHGSLTFNPDGSFSYTPNADFVGNGTDTFTYKAMDGTASSAAAAVTINISEGLDTYDFSHSSANTTVTLGASSGSAITAAGVQKLGAVDIVIGGNGNNTIIGNNLGDILNGGAGNETIRGGTSNDFLIAGAGNDRLTGGGGNDTFVFRTGFGQATVTDFITGNATSHDTLDLRGLGFASIADVLSHTDTGANAVIHVGASHITLLGVTEAQLAAHQFDFSI